MIRFIFIYLSIAGIPPGKSGASGDIWPKNLMLKYRCVSARCRPMRPIPPLEFQLSKRLVAVDWFLVDELIEGIELNELNESHEAAVE